MYTAKLVETRDDEDYMAYDYDCDFIVKTAGDGYWDCEKGRKVHVTGISVSEDKEYGSKSIYVTHDSTWDIYTDTAFEEAISAALGYAVTFTEQGMQEDELASMEA